MIPSETKQVGTDSNGLSAVLSADDPICALATAAGEGAIAIVRASGRGCLQRARPALPFMFRKKSDGAPEVFPESHRAYFGRVLSASGESIDEVLVTGFHEGRSFTGEESFEISCHGSPHVVQSILACLCDLGFRIARPGEFTFRAFRNGRIDLVQAEAVLELIHSRSALGSRNALTQLDGGLSAEYKRIEDAVNWLAAQTEAQIDFSSEGLDYAEDRLFGEKLNDAIDRVKRLLSTARTGQLLAGVNVTLSGRVNAGKSSLFNAVCGFDRAIVSAEAGTTRDYIDHELHIGGFDMRWTDTAGLRDSGNRIEALGIQKGREVTQRSDVVVHLFDLSRTQDWDVDFRQLVEKNARADVLYVFNKVDLDRDGGLQESARRMAADLGVLKQTHFVSAAQNLGVSEVIDAVLEPLLKASVEAGTIVTQARHREELELIQRALLKTCSVRDAGQSPEIVAFELNPAVQACQRLLGRVLHEQVIDRVFKEFCLGK